jgi:hypothetical protein
MVLADSPLACIRCASPAFDLSSALGRPIDWPRALRASRAAAERDAAIAERLSELASSVVVSGP